MISIHLENLTKRFGKATALDRIDLRIEPGELFFLLGPSGCGKTTLLRHIAGFYQPDEGRIRFDGDDVTTLPAHKRNTGMVFQNYALWPHMTVAGNVAFGLEERRLPRQEITQRVNEALASVRMEAYAERKIGQLSGGQQQRVALARALVIRPRCLLLDEPLSNLDAKLRLEMRSEIRRVCKEFGLTAVYVTHDQKEALSIADRMAVLDAGVVAQVGTPLEIYQSPSTRLVADFIGETNFLRGTVTAVGAQGAVTAKTAIGEFQGRKTRSDWAVAVGESVSLSIRPEAWTLQDHANKENSLPGRIGASTYLGEIAQYQFHVGDETLKIFEMNPRFIGAPRETVLHAVAQPQDVIVLKE